ncbi:MAG: hypothetical protein P4L56_03300 [Candidatus Sulfopaludibacter sp.]|nr:hypothetical protein [Candidatus Sulfopaludibacter sp.]
MVRFEELQQLWQNQPPQAPAAFDVRGLTGELRRFGRQQTWINSFKVALLLATFVRILTRTHEAPVAIAGMVLMYIGMITYLVLDWRNQIGISRLDFSAPSVEFIRQARVRLRHQLNPMRRVFWLLAITVGGGFNLLLLAQPRGSLSLVIARHLAATAMPFAVYGIGLKIRTFRFRRECGEVMERLEALIRTMEEKSL